MGRKEARLVVMPANSKIKSYPQKLGDWNIGIRGC